MKKIFLSLAVIASVALVSCGGNKANENNDTVAPEVEEVAVVENDTCCGDSTCGDTVVAVAEEVPAEAGK